MQIQMSTDKFTKAKEAAKQKTIDDLLSKASSATDKYRAFKHKWNAEVLRNRGSKPLDMGLSVKEQASLKARFKEVDQDYLFEFVEMVVTNWEGIIDYIQEHNPKAFWKKTPSKVPNLTDFITILPYAQDHFNEYKGM